MIITQDICILKKDIGTLKKHLFLKGYHIGYNHNRRDADECVFSANREEYSVWFYASARGDVKRIWIEDTANLPHLFRNIAPFIQPGSYLFYTGNYEEIKGYLVSSSGIFDAVDIQVKANRGECLVKKEENSVCF